MRRRALLAGLGALSAGCLSAPATDTDTDRDKTTDSAPPPKRCNRDTDAVATTSTAGTESNAEFTINALSTSSEGNGPSSKYVLEPSKFYSRSAVQREADQSGEEPIVRDISEISNPEVRSAIKTAVESGEYRTNSLPEGLPDTIERVDFVTGLTDGVHTHVGLTLHRLHPDQPPAVEFDAHVVDGIVSDASPGMLALELRNATQTTQHVSAGTVPPFGIVRADAVEGSDGFLLWREYESEGCVTFADDGIIQCSIGTVTKLKPCERLTRRYEILPSETSVHPEYTAPPGHGTYRTTDSISYTAEPGDPESQLSATVTFTLESA